MLNSVPVITSAKHSTRVKAIQTRYYKLFTHAVVWFAAGLALIALALTSPIPVLSFAAGAACLLISAGFGLWAASIARRFAHLVRL